jgi:prevent-host-death family protein
MKRAGVAELKANLSRYLEQVQRGQEVIVTDRGRPVAKLVPLPPAEESAAARRERLIRTGVILPGRGRLRRSLVKRPTRAVSPRIRGKCRLSTRGRPRP